MEMGAFKAMVSVQRARKKEYRILQIVQGRRDGILIGSGGQ